MLRRPDEKSKTADDIERQGHRTTADGRVDLGTIGTETCNISFLSFSLLNCIFISVYSSSLIINLPIKSFTYRAAFYNNRKVYRKKLSRLLRYDETALYDLCGYDFSCDSCSCFSKRPPGLSDFGRETLADDVHPIHIDLRSR